MLTLSSAANYQLIKFSLCEYKINKESFKTFFHDKYLFPSELKRYFSTYTDHCLHEADYLLMLQRHHFHL